MSQDPYIDPVEGILKNELGITNAATLRQAEADITDAALSRLSVRPLPGLYDLEHLRGFHRAIFGDIYAWAGEVRTVIIAKGDVFCMPQFIEPQAVELFSRLAKEDYLRRLDRDLFVDRLTYYFGEINALHPFREGNGRTQRAFLGQLAREVGHPIGWERMNADRNIEVSAKIMRGESGPARGFLDDLIA